MQNDLELLEASLTGDKQSFSHIVERYKSVVCAITYNATGNITLSEDIAQETFIAAWKSLNNLRDKSKFKSWLYGIARNLSKNYIRTKYRDAIHQSIPLEDVQDKISSQVTPRDEAISKEEESILWKALEAIPETYREPLILYYRENQSIKSVAEALDLSEDTVKQRLSRGRNMLRIQVAEFVETTLAQTAPKPTFAIAVLAVLPALTAQITAPGIALTAAKGSTAMKSAVSVLSVGFILSPILANIGSALAGIVGLLSGISLSIISIRSARSIQERKFLLKASIAILIGLAIFYLSIIFVPYYFRPIPWFSSIWEQTIIGFALLFTWIRRRVKKIRIETETYVEQKKIWRQMNKRQWYETVLEIMLVFVCGGVLLMFVSMIVQDWITAITILLATMLVDSIISALYLNNPQRIYKLSLCETLYFYLLAVVVILLRWEKWMLILHRTQFLLVRFMPNRLELILGISILYLLYFLLTYYSYKKFIKISKS